MENSKRNLFSGQSVVGGEAGDKKTGQHIEELANSVRGWRLGIAGQLASLHAKLVQLLAILGPSLMGSLRSSSLEASTSPSAPSLGSIISNVVLPVTSEAAARVVLPFAEVGEGVLANLATALNFDPP